MIVLFDNCLIENLLANNLPFVCVHNQISVNCFGVRVTKWTRMQDFCVLVVVAFLLN